MPAPPLLLKNTRMRILVSNPFAHARVSQRPHKLAYDPDTQIYTVQDDDTSATTIAVFNSTVPPSQNEWPVDATFNGVAAVQSSHIPSNRKRPHEEAFCGNTVYGTHYDNFTVEMNHAYTPPVTVPGTKFIVLQSLQVENWIGCKTSASPTLYDIGGLKIVNFGADGEQNYTWESIISITLSLKGKIVETANADSKNYPEKLFSNTFLKKARDKKEADKINVAYKSHTDSLITRRTLALGNSLNPTLAAHLAVLNGIKLADFNPKWLPEAAPIGANIAHAALFPSDVMSASTDITQFKWIQYNSDTKELEKITGTPFTWININEAEFHAFTRENTFFIRNGTNYSMVTHTLVMFNNIVMANIPHVTWGAGAGTVLAAFAYFPASTAGGKTKWFYEELSDAQAQEILFPQPKTNRENGTFLIRSRNRGENTHFIISTAKGNKIQNIPLTRDLNSKKFSVKVKKTDHETGATTMSDVVKLLREPVKTTSNMNVNWWTTSNTLKQGIPNERL